MPAPIPPERSAIELPDRRVFLRTSLHAATMGYFAIHAEVRGAAEEDVPSATKPVRVRVWCEGTAPATVYPRDIDGAIEDDFRRRKELSVSSGRLSDPDAGLSDAALDATDALIWWGRLRHDDLPDHRAEAIVARVKAGKLGFIALHGSYASKPFRGLFGPSCAPKSWRDDGRPEHVEIKAPDHPIARGIAAFTIPKTATFSEPFRVPEPETVVLVSSWDGGDTFRSGLTWTVDKGRVAYFRPGHDGFPVLFHPTVRQVIANAALWVAPGRPIGSPEARSSDGSRSDLAR
jgi:trehalose utilization protein